MQITEDDQIEGESQNEFRIGLKWEMHEKEVMRGKLIVLSGKFKHILN